MSTRFNPLVRMKFYGSVPLAIFFMLQLISAAAQHQIKQQTPAGTKFWLYTPPGYSSNSHWPLLVTLHGAGTIGDDLDAMLAFRDEIPAKLIRDGKWPASRPFIVVTPQLKRDLAVPDHRDQVWSAELVDELIEYVKQKFSVDHNRIYLTGLSLGGAGVWNYTASYPQKVAAIVPISGVTDTTQACLLKNIPAWVFHGGSDGLVSPKFSTGMVNSIIRCSPDVYIPKVNVLHARRHEGWNEIYNDSNGYNIYDWLLMFSKNNTSNKSPYVNAGGDLKIMLRSTPLHLVGEFFDSDGSISTLQWTQVSGPPLTLNGTNSRIVTLSNLVAGIVEFELTVTDNHGASNRDRVTVQILNAVPSGQSIISSLTLIDGKTNQDIGVLTEGYRIDPLVLGTTEFNIRATATENPLSVRFSVNTDRTSRTTNIPGPYFVIGQSAPEKEWVMAYGEYRICATPYDIRNGNGNAGVSLCVNVVVTNEPPPVLPKIFYAKTGADISLLSSWGTNTDGSGSAPTSFSAEKQTFTVRTNVVSNSPLSITGNESSLWIRSGGSMTIHHRISNVNTESNTSITVNTSESVSFQSLATGTTVVIGAMASTIPAAQYTNLVLQGAKTTKQLPAGNLTIKGNLTIGNDVKLRGAAGTSSRISLSGNFIIEEDSVFQVPVSITFDGGVQQNFILQAGSVELDECIVASNTIVQVSSATQRSIVFGSASGGGLIIEDNAKFMASKNSIHIVNKGVLNSGNQKGRLGFSKSSLFFNSQAPASSYLYTVKNADSVTVLSVAASNASPLFIADVLFITDSIKIKQGTVHSDGNLSLVATPEKQASIRRMGDSGSIQGAIQLQQIIGSGKHNEYISFPLSGVSVASVQHYIPITGNFSGASSGSGLSGNPSLFYYHEPEWHAYPAATNQELFSMGKGYRLTVPAISQPVTLITTGNVHRGNFTFVLQSAENSSRGKWNLLGNPFASPILWSDSGWIASGVGRAVYVRDKDSTEDKFLVWDGETGDEEFSGIISQGQAFWARSINAVPHLTVQELAKVQGNSRPSSGDKTYSVMALELSNGNFIDRSFIKLKKGGSDRFDERHDAVKRMNERFSLFTLSEDSVALAINTIDQTACGKNIRLRLKLKEKGAYTLTFKGDLLNNRNAKIYVTDNVTGTTVLINKNLQYNFSVTEEAIENVVNRFQLQFESAMAKPVITNETFALSSSYEEGNQWYLNGEEIKGATSSTYTPLQSGEYSVQVTQGDCIHLSEPVLFMVTSLNNDIDTRYKIFPNPASTRLHLESNSEANRNSQNVFFTVVNVMGNEVNYGELSSDDLVNGITMDISGFAPGVYFLKLYEKDATFYFKVMIEK
jgi:predicted esterase